MSGDVEQGVEAGETQGAHRRHEQKARTQGLPVAAKMPARENGEQRNDPQPAQADQRHGRYFTDGKAPEDRVGAPAQRGRSEQDVCPAAARGRGLAIRRGPHRREYTQGPLVRHALATG